MGTGASKTRPARLLPPAAATRESEWSEGPAGLPRDDVPPGPPRPEESPQTAPPPQAATDKDASDGRSGAGE